MRYVASASVVLIVTLASGSGTASGAPEPSLIARAWQVDFRFHDPQRIGVRLATSDKPVYFRYMIYTLQNETGRERDVYPVFEWMTDTMEVIESDMGINPAVYAAIKQRHRKTHPFLLPPARARGRLLVGEDHAKTSVAIWPEKDVDCNNFTIYVAGLSGETARVVNPAYDRTRPQTETKKLPNGQQIEVIVNPRVFILRKTLAVKYRLPGNATTRGAAKPIRQKRLWLMR